MALAGGGGVLSGSSTRTCAMIAWRRLLRFYGRVCTNIHTSREQLRRASSLFPRRRPKKCITRKLLAEERRIGSELNSWNLPQRPRDTEVEKGLSLFQVLLRASVPLWQLNCFQFLPRKLIFYIACVQSRRRFEQEHFAFVFGKGPMLDAARHDDEFTRLNPLREFV